MQKTILIADDSMFMRTILKRILKKHNYKVIAEASNGFEAVENYKKYNPDFVFLDITMEKKNGLDALAEIVEIDKKAKVIMCSAMGQQSFIMQAIQLGAKDFIVKPFIEERILSALENLS